LHDTVEPTETEEREDTGGNSSAVPEEITSVIAKNANEGDDILTEPVEEETPEVVDAEETRRENSKSVEELISADENPSEAPADVEPVEENAPTPVQSQQNEKVSAPVDVKEVEEETPAPAEVDDDKVKAEHSLESENTQETTSTPEAEGEVKDDVASEVEPKTEDPEKEETPRADEPEELTKDATTPSEESVLIESDEKPEEDGTQAPIEESVFIEPTLTEAETSSTEPEEHIPDVEPEASIQQTVNQTPLTHEENFQKGIAIPTHEQVKATKPRVVKTGKLPTQEHPGTALNAVPEPVTENPTELNGQEEIATMLPVHAAPITA
jgi:hypothetical protein